MSVGPKKEKLNYDQSDGSSKTILVQIDLPSTRIEIAPNQTLFKEEDGKKVEVKANDIVKGDLLYVIRDDEENQMVTERVMEVQQRKRNSADIKDIIFVNNVVMKIE